MVEVDNTYGEIKFPCPSCGKTEIVRTMKERAMATKYKCPSCGFEGPN